MVRKPGRMYRRVEGPAYTRREYIGGVPHPKIFHFELGNVDAKEQFPVEFHLVAEEACQIRHMALEAARIAANKHLARYVGNNNFYMQVKVYPHHVIREHKMATGAGADRISSGMSLAFGKPVGTAARVRRGQTLIVVRSYPDRVRHVKEALRKAAMKFPTPCRIKVVRGQDLLKF